MRPPLSPPPLSLPCAALHNNPDRAAGHPNPDQAVDHPSSSSTASSPPLRPQCTLVHENPAGANQQQQGMVMTPPVSLRIQLLGVPFDLFIVLVCQTTIGKSLKFDECYLSCSSPLHLRRSPSAVARLSFAARRTYAALPPDLVVRESSAAPSSSALHSCFFVTFSASPSTVLVDDRRSLPSPAKDFLSDCDAQVQLSSRYNIFPLSENTPHRQAPLLARADIAKLSFPSAPSWSLPVAIDYLCSSSSPCPCGSRRRPLPSANFFHTAPCNSLFLHHLVSSRSLHPRVRQKSGGQRWQISAPTTSFWATEAADRCAQALDLRAPPGRRHLVPHHAHPGRRHGASRYRSRASGHGARPSTSRPSHWSRAAGHGARPSTPDDPGLPQGSRDLSTKTQDLLGRTLAGPQPCSSATVKTNCHKCRRIVNVVWCTSCDRRGYCNDCIRCCKDMLLSLLLDLLHREVQDQREDDGVFARSSFKTVSSSSRYVLSIRPLFSSLCSINYWSTCAFSEFLCAGVLLLVFVLE
ncbi:uncharacterized protein LOC124696739 [Lolium rigidum]|uniref:uncharacterized protein LOC124696739 n=1 Tax=Lolium rigidum TaxID=89674 RepID=UPI001F5D50B3|nr:uncharacterized protein LOC124696739 [Lolium rigidum]